MSRRVPFALFVLCLSAGCSTHATRLVEVRTAYFDGDVAGARAKIETSLKKHPREADVLKLDQATVFLSDDKPREAEKLLREVRDRFDHLEQKSLAEGALAMLTDDQALAYAGEDYEKVLVRAFLALSNLMSDGQDAEAFALQVGEKQRQIVESGKAPDGKNPKESYKLVPVGAYLHAALREQTHVNYDDAARSLEQVCQWAPDCRQARQDLERVRGGHHSARGNGVLYVFTLVGRGPYKEERAEIPTQAALLIADRILSMTAKHSLPPTVAPVKVPRVVVPANEVQSVRVAVDGRGWGQTETVTDVGRLATEQADALMPYVIARAVARRVVKKGTVYTVKEALPSQAGGAVMEIGLDIAGVVWEATEAADTRCWGLLPEKIQVLRVELPAGEHQLALEPVGVHGGAQGPAQTATVRVEDGRNAYVLAGFPTGRLAGKVVCGQGR